MNQAERFKDVFFIIPWIQKLRIRPQKAPIPTSQITQDVLDQLQIIYQDVFRNAMQVYIKYEAHYDRKSTLQSSKKQIIYKSYSRTQIIKGIKFFLWNSGELAPTLTKKFYQITII